MDNQDNETLVHENTPLEEQVVEEQHVEQVEEQQSEEQQSEKQVEEQQDEQQSEEEVAEMPTFEKKFVAPADEKTEVLEFYKDDDEEAVLEKTKRLMMKLKDYKFTENSEDGEKKKLVKLKFKSSKPEEN